MLIGEILNHPILNSIPTERAIESRAQMTGATRFVGGPTTPNTVSSGRRCALDRQPQVCWRSRKFGGLGYLAKKREA